jgi:hypothetical protein
MPLHFFGPRLSRARVSSQWTNRVVSTIDAVQIWEKVQGDYLQGAIALIANGFKGKGSLSRRILGRAGYAGGVDTNRYYVQINDENGNNQTVICTTGVLDLPAAIVSGVIVKNYVSVRIVGSSFGLSDVFYPQSGEGFGVQVPFRGGRG